MVERPVIFRCSCIEGCVSGLSVSEPEHKYEFLSVDMEVKYMPDLILFHEVMLELVTVLNA